MPEPHGGAYKTFPDAPGSFADGARDGSLSALFRSAVTHAQDRIDWFDKKAGSCSGTAKRIRRWSLIFFAFGTLAPIVGTLFGKLPKAYPRSTTAHDFVDEAFNFLWQLPLAEIGYVVLAIAGALVIFDRFFDSSGSWMRFRQAQARLEVLLAEFRYQWAALMSQSGGTIAADSFVGPGLGAQCTKLLGDFVKQVEGLAEDETKEWAKTFQAEIDSFDSQVKAAGSKSSADAAAAAAAQSAAAAVGPQKDGAAAAAKSGASTPQTVDVKIFIPDASTLDAGSLKLAVNDNPQTVDPGGYAEFSLSVGAAYTLAASGTRAGVAVTGNLRLTPSINQQGAVLVIKIY